MAFQFEVRAIPFIIIIRIWHSILCVMSLPFSNMKLPFSNMSLPFSVMRLPFSTMSLPCSIMKLPFSIMSPVFYYESPVFYHETTVFWERETEPFGTVSNGIHSSLSTGEAIGREYTSLYSP